MLANSWSAVGRSTTPSTTTWAGGRPGAADLHGVTGFDVKVGGCLLGRTTPLSARQRPDPLGNNVEYSGGT